MSVYITNVTTLSYEPQRCIGCAMCAAVCPQAVFALEDGKARITDRDACMECGACARNCPAEAIAVRAGVGCASGIIMGSLGKQGDCCCTLED